MIGHLNSSLNNPLIEDSGISLQLLCRLCHDVVIMTFISLFYGRASTDECVFHHVQHVIQPVETGPHSNIPKQVMI